MKILVIDVAAEYGGAVSVLDQFIEEFSNKKDNHYIVVLSKLHYNNTDNITFINCAWVKKSHFHRLFFDQFYIKRIIKDTQPDKIFSLQNNAFPIDDLPQDVYFHNALPISEKRFSIFVSKSLWIYQNIIGNIIKNSLKYADNIYVQANWIKRTLNNKWDIDKDKIIVKFPVIELPKRNAVVKPEKKDERKQLFYPANGSIYKNHIVLLKALESIWRENNNKSPKLVLTGTLKSLPKECQQIINKGAYPIEFVGRLNKQEMVEKYKESVLVFPSYIETIGLPLLEAKALGCEIIVADCEYAHEVISNYGKVVFFDPNSFEDLIRVLRLKQLN